MPRKSNLTFVAVYTPEEEQTDEDIIAQVQVIALVNKIPLSPKLSKSIIRPLPSRRSASSQEQTPTYSSLLTPEQKNLVEQVREARKKRRKEQDSDSAKS